MKTLFVLFLAMGFSISVFAQNSLRNNKFQALKFGNLKSLNRIETFPISTNFQMGVDTLGLQYPFNKSNNIIKTANSFSLNKFQKYRSNMPVLNPRSSSNMPVFVPDSTINFVIIEKRYDLVNPLETNN